LKALFSDIFAPSGYLVPPASSAAVASNIGRDAEIAQTILSGPRPEHRNCHSSEEIEISWLTRVSLLISQDRAEWHYVHHKRSTIHYGGRPFVINDLRDTTSMELRSILPMLR
jgi:hypothetical protein